MSVSKMIASRQKSAMKVRAAAQSHGESARAGVAEIMGEEMGELSMSLMDAAAQTLKSAEEAMVAADEAHNAEMSDDAVGRELRDAKIEDVREVLIDFKNLSNAVYGGRYTGEVGFEGETPKDGIMLHRLGLRVVNRIDTVALPAPKFEGMAFDAGLWKEKITVPTQALGDALADIAREEREAERTLNAKRKTMADYDDVFSKVAGLVSALLNIAGEKELAAKVRPSKNRPGRVSDDAFENDPQ